LRRSMLTSSSWHTKTYLKMKDEQEGESQILTNFRRQAFLDIHFNSADFVIILLSLSC
jgi:hypothetical protein